eukprot:6187655-Pleurochrysis_carterae.AAC.1
MGGAELPRGRGRGGARRARACAAQRAPRSAGRGRPRRAARRAARETPCTRASPQPAEGRAAPQLSILVPDPDRG